jgi:DNA invertase Pin-like site-specific DNA recombinase
VRVALYARVSTADKGHDARVQTLEDARRSISEAYAMGGVSLRQLAVRFGTSIGTVQRCIQLYQKTSTSLCYPFNGKAVLLASRGARKDFLCYEPIGLTFCTSVGRKRSRLTAN